MGGGGLSWIPIIGPLIDPPKAPEISLPAISPAPVWESTDSGEAQATADAAAAKKAATEAEKAAQGRKATLLTSAQGDTSTAPVKRKTLLGS